MRDRDRNAVLLWLLWHHQGGSSDIGQPIRAMLGMGQHDHLTDAQVTEARRIEAALTREAAPQASGGDDPMRLVRGQARAWEAVVEVLDKAVPDWNRADGTCAMDRACSLIRRLATPDSAPKLQNPELQRQLEKGVERYNELPQWMKDAIPTDSAIQSQQGATGGAVDDNFARIERNIVPVHVGEKGARIVALCKQMGYDDETTALMVFTEMVLAADPPGAHPQAAGSAPVGVDAKDAARYRHMRRRLTSDDGPSDAMARAMFNSDPWALDAAIDAALEKERAE